jgi:hypothetical protein
MGTHIYKLFLFLSKTQTLYIPILVNKKIHMLQTTIYTILFAISLVIHQVIFAFFTFSLFRIFLYKNTPYASLCVAIVCIIQVVCNGCPVTDINNFLLLKAGFTDVDSNAFWGGIFGDYTGVFRLVFLFISIIMFYYSFKTWKKVPVQVSPSRIFRKPTIQNLA